MSVDRISVLRKQKFFDEAAATWHEVLSDPDRSLLDSLVRTFKLSLPASNAPVLDVGCGTGVLFGYLYDTPFCAVDISYEMLLRARRERHQMGLGLCQADAHTLPFADKSFRGIIAFAVFPHLVDHLVFLSECYRVLVPEGVLSIVHLRPARAINSFHSSVGGVIANDHLPDKAEMQDLLEASSFYIELIQTKEHYHILARKR